MYFKTTTSYILTFLIISILYLSCGERSIVDTEIIIPGTTVLLADDNVNVEPAWSPDGTRIAYTAINDDGSSIWQIASSGREPQPLIVENRGEHSPTWSADGRELTFSSWRSGSFDIWSLSLIDGSMRQLTDTKGDELHPRWSPDGSMLAFISDGRLAIMDSSGLRTTIKQEYANSVTELSWDATGETIYFSQIQNHKKLLLSLTLESLDVHPLQTPEFEGGYPSAAPFGTEIYDLVGPQLAYEALNGIRVYSLFDAESRSVVMAGKNPCWSPGGNQIAYSQNGDICIETIWILFDE